MQAGPDPTAQAVWGRKGGGAGGREDIDLYPRYLQWLILLMTSQQACDQILLSLLVNLKIGKKFMNHTQVIQLGK